VKKEHQDVEFHNMPSNLIQHGDLHPLTSKRTRAEKQQASRAKHRLLSILYDAQALALSTSKEHLCLANERCGSWYLPSSTPSCYFKSTDGHVNTWQFSLKRLNLPVLQYLHQHNTITIVDASVRKRLPDSLSRTIPLWACVWNRVLLRLRQTYLGNDQMYPPGYTQETWDIDWHVPTSLVSSQEREDVHSLLEDRVNTLLQSGAIVQPNQIIQWLQKPIRVVEWRSDHGRWIQRGEEQGLDCPTMMDRSCYYCIIACNPSMYTATESNDIQQQDQSLVFPKTNSFLYTPGAADDAESWARHWESHDLRPQDSCSYWISQLVTRTEGQVDDYLDKHRSSSDCNETRTTICYHSNIGQLSLSIGSRRAGRPPECWQSYEAILNVTTQEYSMGEGHYYLQMPIPEGKRDKYGLETWLPVGLVFLMRHSGRRSCLVHCAQGKDRSVGVVLAFVMCACRLQYPLRALENVEWNLEMLEREAIGESLVEASDEDELYKQSGLSSRLVSYLLLQEKGRDAFLRWVHNQTGRPMEDGPLATKESIRIALHMIRQDREVAEPTRATLQKLNRFFMSSPLYRGDNN